MYIWVDRHAGFIINHNGDYSGDIRLCLPSDSKRIKTYKSLDVTSGKAEDILQVEIPFETIRDFVLKTVIQKKIEALEGTSEEAFWDRLTTDV